MSGDSKDGWPSGASSEQAPVAAWPQKRAPTAAHAEANTALIEARDRTMALGSVNAWLEAGRYRCTGEMVHTALRLLKGDERRREGHARPRAERRRAHHAQHGR